MNGWSQSLPTPRSSDNGSVEGTACKSERDQSLDPLLPTHTLDFQVDRTTEPDNALRIPLRVLNTGALCPGIGYGTGGEGRATPDELYQAIRVALDRGYRSFDLAPFYQDGLVEQTVGRAIRESGVPRSDIFLATKVWPTFSRCPEQSLNMSLANLGMSYVDCLLLHWPIPLRPVPGDPYAMGDTWDAGWDFKKTWAEMQNIPYAKTRAIGVCNFTVNRLELLLTSPTTTVVPAILQVEGHPELPQKPLMEYCRQKGIQVFCFSPLAQGQVANRIIQHVAEFYGVDAGQIAISWAIQRGTVPLPKSTNLNRICSNMSLVHLDAEAMDMLDQLGEQPRRIVNPRIFFGHDIFESNIDSYPKQYPVEEDKADDDEYNAASAIPHKRQRT